mgnify:CR=1 FL=1
MHFEPAADFFSTSSVCAASSPAFFASVRPSAGDLADGFALTGFFLARDVLEPLERDLRAFHLADERRVGQRVEEGERLEVDPVGLAREEERVGFDRVEHRRRRALGDVEDRADLPRGFSDRGVETENLAGDGHDELFPTGAIGDHDRRVPRFLDSARAPFFLTRRAIKGDDAVALIDALSTSSTVAEALQRYEALRVPFGCHVVGYARQLGAYLQAQLKTQEERDAAERHFSPEAVLRDTATVGFMTV